MDMCTSSCAGSAGFWRYRDRSHPSPRHKHWCACHGPNTRHFAQLRSACFRCAGWLKNCSSSAFTRSSCCRALSVVGRCESLSSLCTTLMSGLYRITLGWSHLYCASNRHENHSYKMIVMGTWTTGPKPCRTRDLQHTPHRTAWSSIAWIDDREKRSLICSTKQTVCGVVLKPAFRHRLRHWDAATDQTAQLKTIGNWNREIPFAGEILIRTHPELRKN